MLCWQTVPEGTVVSHADFVRMKADELASYDSARREERQRRYVSDANMITRAMAQLAAEGGETADVDRIQEVLHDLLREYGQRAEFAGLPPGDATVLSAFIGAETQMLDTATARLHSCSRPSKAERQAYGRRITIPAQHAPAAAATAGAISESSDQTMSRLAPTRMLVSQAECGNVPNKQPLRVPCRAGLSLGAECHSAAGIIGFLPMPVPRLTISAVVDTEAD